MLIRCMGAGLGRKLMHFYFREEEDRREEERSRLQEYSVRLREGIFVLILTASDWDDFGFKTDFVAWIHNVKTGIKHGLGTLKVGYNGQPEGSWTIHNEKIRNIITNKLDDDFFSMFNSEESYRAIFKYFNVEYEELLSKTDVKIQESKEQFVINNVHALLNGVNDIVYTKKIKLDRELLHESVFRNSFLRSTSIETILYSYDDIVYQKRGATNFEINVKGLEFRSSRELNPSTNIHALIGSNGSGKSCILDSIVSNYIDKIDNRIKKLIIISFSPFDKQTSFKKSLLSDSSSDIKYIGLKDFYIEENNFNEVLERLKSKEDIQNDFIDNFYLAIKKNIELVRYIFDELEKSHPNSQWSRVGLGEIFNINEIGFEYYKKEREEYYSNKKKTTRSNIVKDLLNSLEKEIPDDYVTKKLSDDNIRNENKLKFSELSSGYQMIAYSLFSLVAHLENGTLVLYDEPEVYLHPPLMLTYMKILREIFKRRNGMGIFATHSPIILQEIPKSCVKVIRKINDNGKVSYLNLKQETYASGITTINNEIFKLEAKHTGFYNDIYKKCEEVEISQDSKNLDEEEKINSVLNFFKNQVGDEGLSIMYDFFYKDEK